MWKDLESVQTISKRATWWAVLLAFISGIAGLISIADTTLQILTVASVVFAFVSASAGVFSLIADKRKDKLEDEFKKTPPKIEVAIKTGEKNGKFLVVIEPRNRVPFEEQWVIVRIQHIVEYPCIHHIV
jgi:hypothetical protein